MASTKPAAKTATAKAAADTTAAADAKAAEAKAAEAKAQSAKPAAKAPVKKPGLIVSTRKGVKSFRRAGLAFTEAETTIAADTLKAEQIEALKSEPMLTVRELDDISDSE
ncbi:MAG: hypothetical protein CMI04_08850 [Oceanospirillaceae bacterium]|nr:hypothetical protein [Oceanospirillaceae bacterium]|tara:strand:+ start:9213 stop:9542 length:330 start_codon:yes stop_codon:yes gene_type:complete